MGIRGFSLIEVIVAIAISAVVLGAVSQLILSNQNQVRSLSQKQEIVELKNLIIEQLADLAVCSSKVQGQAVDISPVPTEAAPSPTVIDLSPYHQGAGTAGPVIAQAGQPLRSSQHGLVVSGVTFKNIYFTGVPELYNGIFEIAFAPGQGTPLRPMEVRKRVRINGAGTIQGCVPGGDGLFFAGWPDALICDRPDDLDTIWYVDHRNTGAGGATPNSICYSRPGQNQALSIQACFSLANGNITYFRDPEGADASCNLPNINGFEFRYIEGR